MSYPPFSFILPYFVFKITGQDASVGGIRIFSLLIHFICALLIFLIVYKFNKKRLSEDYFIPAYVAFCFYVFATGNLWFHSNFYFADSLVHVFVLGLINVFLSIVQQPETKTSKNISLLFTLTFLGIYTEWLALFAAFFVLALFIFKSFKTKIYIKYSLSIILATIFSLGLTVLQYSYIAGFNVLKNYSLLKFSRRSGFNEQTAIDGTSIYNTQSYKTIYSYYLTNYNYLVSFALLFGFAFLMLYFVNLKTKKVKFEFNPLLVLILISLTVATHHVVFFNFTAIHDVSTLKMTLPVCLFVGYFFALVFAYAGEVSKKTTQVFAVLFCGAFVFYSSQEYLRFSSDDTDKHFQKLTGDAVAKYANPDELVFTNVGISPVLMWHAQRNLVQSDNKKKCAEILDSLNYSKGIFFKISTQNNNVLLKVTRVNAMGDTIALN
ncbi:MAG: hypothetical protein KA163_07865 [Bacteroidia bacterium]|nr:hypothetical protein [Bacteroidia bacterium]